MNNNNNKKEPQYICANCGQIMFMPTVTVKTYRGKTKYYCCRDCYAGIKDERIKRRKPYKW